MASMIQSTKSGGICSICLDKIKKTDSSLTHTGPDGQKHDGFHKSCLQKLFDAALQNQTAFRCPMCRTIVNPYGTIYRIPSIFQRIRAVLIHVGNRRNLTRAIAAATIGTVLGGLPEILRRIVRVAGMTILGGAVVRDGRNPVDLLCYYGFIFSAILGRRELRHRSSLLAIGLGIVSNEIFTQQRMSRINQLIIGITMYLGAAERIGRSRGNAMLAFSSVGFLTFGVLSLLPRR